MSEHTAKPYLVRAIYEWCSDYGHTPYLAVRVDSQTRVPQAFVKNGEIVLNVSATATRHLKIDNDWIQFSARFNGVSHEVSVPMSAVAGVFARETGYGFAFSAEAEPPVPAAASAGSAPRTAASPTSPVAAAPAAAPAAKGTAAKPPAAAPADKAPEGGEGPSEDPAGPDKPRGRPNLQVVK